MDFISKKDIGETVRVEKRARCSYCVMQAKIQATGSIWNGILPVTVY